MTKLSAITSDHPILLIGCGKMGSAMLSGWLEQGLSSDAVQIVDPYLDNIKRDFAVLPAGQFHETMQSLLPTLCPAIIILAVKPQMMDEALKALTSFDLSNSLILSIAAGKTIHYFKDKLGQDSAIIRAMPNTPAAIGKGITVCCTNKPVSQDQIDTCTTLLNTVSIVEWIDDESLIDAVTALSGSGPAYVFYMAEAMAAAGEAIGLPPGLSEKLARHTVSGAGALLEASDERTSKLRENVTSPGGATAVALDVLMSEEGLARVIRRAMQAAKTRSKELAN